MDRPKFEVGEEVILQSRQMPEHNGEYFVDRVVYDGCDYKDRLTGIEFVINWGDDCGYLLSNMAKNPHLGTRSFGTKLRYARNINLLKCLSQP